MTENSIIDRSDDRPRRLFWLLPTLTFLVGLVLGGGLVALGSNDAESAIGQPPPSSSAPTPSGVPSAGESGDGTVVVPQECVAAADTSLEVLDLVRKAVAAIGDLDARRLQEIVDRLQELDPEVTRLAETCRTEAADKNFGSGQG